LLRKTPPKTIGFCIGNTAILGGWGIRDVESNLNSVNTKTMKYKKSEFFQNKAERKTHACFTAFCSLLILAAVLSCNRNAEQGEPALTVHYYRYNGDYEGWNVWAWPLEPPGDGTSAAFDGEHPDEDGFVSAKIFFPAGKQKIRELGVIARKSTNDNEWAYKDGQNDRFTVEKEIWLVQNDPVMYNEKPKISGPPILFAVADSPDAVMLTLAKEPDDYGVFAVYQNGRKISGLSRKLSDAAADSGDADDSGDSGNGGPITALILLNEKIIDPSLLYTVQDESGVYSGRNVVMRGVLDSFYYAGADLGLSYRSDQSVFKVWAPTARALAVALYDTAGQYNSAGKLVSQETERLHPMEKDAATGVWTARVSGDLAGAYYMYRVEFADGTATWAADPYARSVSANGQRMAIVDLAATNPPGWQPRHKPPFPPGAWQDAVIYELHVRDFSVDVNSGMRHKGKFLAFTERGTTLNGTPGGTPTGVDHLLRLGITHVHLLPSFDFASINELAVDDPSSNESKHNWGYDPMHFNVPEGSYSSDPNNPVARITEFKQMVQALHDAGIRVIMDMVYNHTFHTGTWPFDTLVPGYYYRTTDTGDYANGSGCGNEVASERPMVRKFIVDSCVYWASEYGIDGLRFDLMGIIDTPTMSAIVSAVREIDPSIIVYGEPWGGGASALSGELQTVIGAQKGRGFAVFNDRIRGAIKGGSDDPSRGFASGQSSTEAGIVRGLMGSIHDFTAEANESVNYVTAHDNLNLWDKFALSHGAKNLAQSPYGLIKSARGVFDSDAVKSTLLANGIVFTSQGIPFFQAGDEMLRSKFGDHNSYASGDEINKIRWENAALYGEIIDYYAGLIRLRKEHPAFRQSAASAIEQSLEILEQNDLGVSFVLNASAAGDSWRAIFVAYNGGAKARRFALPDSAAVWQQVVDSRRAGIDTLAEHSGSVSVPGFSMAVLHD